MGIYDNLSEFKGRPVRDWNAAGDVRDPQGAAYRLAVSWDEAEKGTTTNAITVQTTTPQTTPATSHWRRRRALREATVM